MYVITVDGTPFDRIHLFGKARKRAVARVQRGGTVRVFREDPIPQDVLDRVAAEISAERAAKAASVGGWDVACLIEEALLIACRVDVTAAVLEGGEGDELHG